MTVVAYYSPFVPAEWISAHGLSPLRRRPRSSAAPPLAGICTYAHSFFREACEDPDVGAIVLTSDCDQIRRIAEASAEPPGKPVFHMHVPTTWQTTNAHRYYVSEVERLGRFLVGLGGTAPAPERLAEEIGALGAVQAAGVAANFEIMNRVVDAVGLPLGRGNRRMMADEISLLRTDRFPHAQH